MPRKIHDTKRQRGAQQQLVFLHCELLLRLLVFCQLCLCIIAVLRHLGATVAQCCKQLLLQRCNAFQHSLLIGIILPCKLGSVFRKAPTQVILERSQMARQAGF